MQAASKPGLRITVTLDEGQTLEQLVDKDIEAFEAYFCEELKNDRLSKPERSIIKTLYWWKTHQENTGG